MNLHKDKAIQSKKKKKKTEKKEKTAILNKQYFRAHWRKVKNPVVSNSDAEQTAVIEG